MFCKECLKLKEEIKNIEKRLKNIEKILEESNKINVYFYDDKNNCIEKIFIETYDSDFLKEYFKVESVIEFINSNKLIKEKQIHCKIINKKELIIHNNFKNLNIIIERFK